jgi:uncharacterized protein
LKLHAQINADFNAVTGYGPDYIEVNRIRHPDSMILAGAGPVQSWAAGALELLRPEDLAPVLALDPEVVLIGTGAVHRFPPLDLLRPLIERGVGFEVMDTGAACRTFNILIGEGRRVVAALLLPRLAAGAGSDA